MTSCPSPEIPARSGVREVARRAGVSKTTAAYILRGQRIERFAASTCERVQQAAAELGYVPNLFARGLKTGRSGLVAVYFGDIGAADLRSGGSNLIFARFFAEVCGAGIHRGLFPVTLLHSREAPETDKHHLHAVLSSGAGGLLAYCPAPEMVDFLSREVTPDLPVVSIFARFPKDANVVNIEVDNFGVGVSGVRHLLGLGCRRIVAVRDRPDLPPGLRRQEGYETAMREAGLEPRVFLLEPLADRAGRDSFARQEQGRRGVRALNADAFFCLTAGSSTRISRWLVEESIVYPSDVALVGVDVSVAENGLPFTGYTAPWASIAQTALDLLDRLMTGGRGDVPAEINVPADFSPGETCPSET